MSKNRNIRLPFVFLIFIVITACNFPLLVRYDPYNEIPWPTPGNALTKTAEPPPSLLTQTIVPEQPPPIVEEGYFLYFAQSGDTLDVVATHFGVAVEQIRSPQSLDLQGLLFPGQQLIIPDVFGAPLNATQLLPDSEVIFSPSAQSFNIQEYVQQYGGYLTSFHQLVGTEVLSGAEIVQRVSKNTSINPRLLLAVIEFRSKWVTSSPQNPNLTSPLGFYYHDYQGFYLECSLAAKWINSGYYGWRQGALTEINFSNGGSLRIPPSMNAGSVGLQYFLAQSSPQGNWEDQLYGMNSLVSLFTSMFGDPWARAAQVEPLFPTGLISPELELPFAPGEEWALTGGLHYSWNSGTPNGALDFAPITGERPCVVSTAWVLASASGRVVHSSNNIVIVTLEDANQVPTGWELFYMHIAQKDLIPVGTHVNLDDRIGHPSCEGGVSTGTHVHFARKFKGEWISASGPFPLILSGWTAIPGEGQFRSVMVKGAQIVTARQDGSIDSRIFR